MPLTKLNNKSVANVTSIPVALGDMVLVSSATASSSASIEFTLGDYKEYKFFFVNIHPSSDGVNFTFQGSTNGGSSYGVTITTTAFISYNNESGSPSALSYNSGQDLAQSTSFQSLIDNIGNGNDECCSGSLTLFNPSSTTYVKHFLSRIQSYNYQDYSREDYIAGYFNDTNDLTNIKFQFASGNIDDGKILMFGIN